MEEKSWLFGLWTECLVPEVGAGLDNVGNTCFLNAVLQCLTHTVPLVEKLRASDHYSTCSAGPGEFCALCALRHHIDNCLVLSGYVFEPKDIATNLSKISSEFVRGFQEDAHEFLHCLLNKVHSCCINPVFGNQLPPMGDDTDSLIKQVFGGRARSRLRCSDCGHVSDTFESLLDLSLGIDGMASLTEALESYTKVEMLEPSECDGCHAKVPKEKQVKLDQAPQVALFHLKRFKIDGSGACKINNFVEFPLVLDLQPFVSSPQDEEQLNYDLYAVVVHRGNLESGHYFSIIRSSQSSWYLMDDAQVAGCSTMLVLERQAYMLFYIKQGSSPWVSSLIQRQMTWEEKNFVIAGSSSSSSMDAPETREDQSPGTDDTPESVIYGVEGDSSSSTPLRPCNQGGISYGAEKNAPLGEVMKQSTIRPGSEEYINDETSTLLIEDDQEDHQSPESRMTQSPQPLILGNPIPMKRQRRALSDLDNIPSPSSFTPEESQSHSPLLHEHDFLKDNS